MLMSDEIWQHPLCAAFDGELRDRLRAAAGRRAGAGRRGRRAARPAQPRRRLPQQPAGRRADDELVMIDFGFWGGAPVGLRPHPAPGRRRADRQARRRRPRRARRGDRDGVRRGAARRGLRRSPRRRSAAAHALCLLLMTGLSTAALRPVRGADHPRDAADRRGPGDAGPLRLDLLERDLRLSRSRPASGSRSSSM